MVHFRQELDQFRSEWNRETMAWEGGGVHFWAMTRLTRETSHTTLTETSH
jgi:hypothetical protein